MATAAGLKSLPPIPALPPARPPNSKRQRDEEEEEPLTVKKSKEDPTQVVADLFKRCIQRGKNPISVLEKLTTSEFAVIGECHCVPQLSRLDRSAGKDFRKIAEDALCAKITEKFPKKDQLLTICSIASATGFQDLVFLTKICSIGFNKIKWVLVDPRFFHHDMLTPFSKIAYRICPGIKFDVVEDIDDLPKVELNPRPDVFILMDQGPLGGGLKDCYFKKIERLEKFILESPKPTVYLTSAKDEQEPAFNEKLDKLVHKVRVTIKIFFNSKDALEEFGDSSTEIPDSHPLRGRISTADFMGILDTDHYRAVQYCILNHEADVTHRDEAGNTPLLLMAQKGKCNSVKALVEVGKADVTSINLEGRTALHLACDFPNITSYLISQGAVDITLPKSSESQE